MGISITITAENGAEAAMQLQGLLTAVTRAEPVGTPAQTTEAISERLAFSGETTVDIAMPTPEAEVAAENKAAAASAKAEVEKPKPGRPAKAKPAKPEPVAEPEPVVESAPVVEAEVIPTTAESGEPLTGTHLTALLRQAHDMLGEGVLVEMRAILKQFGANRVSEVKAEDIPAVHARVKEKYDEIYALRREELQGSSAAEVL